MSDLNMPAELPKHPGLVCEHCGREGAPKLTVRHFGIACLRSAKDLIDLDDQALAVGDTEMSAFINRAADHLEKYGLRVLGAEDASHHE
jgi:hypothetical protein